MKPEDYGTTLNIIFTAVIFTALLIGLKMIVKERRTCWTIPTLASRVYVVTYILEPAAPSYQVFAAKYPELYAAQDTFNIKDVLRFGTLPVLVSWLLWEVTRGYRRSGN